MRDPIPNIFQRSYMNKTTDRPRTVLLMELVESVRVEQTQIIMSR